MNDFPTAWRSAAAMRILGRAVRATPVSVAALLVLSASQATPEQARPGSFNIYGTPGLIDLPTAETAPDATLSTTVGHFGDTTRSTLTFQITPRLSGSFRYTRIADFYPTINGSQWTDPAY